MDASGLGRGGSHVQEAEHVGCLLLLFKRGHTPPLYYNFGWQVGTMTSVARSCAASLRRTKTKKKRPDF